MKKEENAFFDLPFTLIRLRPEDEKKRWNALAEKENKRIIEAHGSFENYINFLQKKDEEFFKNFNPWEWYSIVGNDVKE